jgi:hypothetical protein
MNFPRPSRRARLLALIAACALAGCAAPSATPTSAVQFTFATETPVAATATAVILPTLPSRLEQPSTTPSPTTAPTQVTITAATGDLYIRRGPGSDFNPIGALLQGQSAVAAGRDILSQWLYIPIPARAGDFGWVSTLTQFARVSGVIVDLPVVDSPLAVPAFIRNCSTQEMIVEPLGVVIPPGSSFPDNIVQFDPGQYSIHNYDLPGQPGVTSVYLVEGEQFDITAKNTPAQHKCPDQ